MKSILIGLLLANVLVYIHAGGFRGIRIEKNMFGRWLCDMIDCPEKTEYCLVTRSNKETPSVLKRINKCYSSYSEVLNKKEKEYTIDPKKRVDQFVVMHQNGTFDVPYFSGQVELPSERPNEFKANWEHFSKLVKDMFERAG